MSDMKLTQRRLKELLNYDQKTGLFTRKVITANCMQLGDVAGNKNSNGYIRIGVLGTSYFAHRLAWLFTYGYFPENGLDHINRVKGDNSIKNLREVSVRCNARNSCISSRNKSGITGVYWCKTNKKWIAQIGTIEKTIHLGIFVSKREAAKARWNAEVKYNFPNCNTTSSAYLYLNSVE